MSDKITDKMTCDQCHKTFNSYDKIQDHLTHVHFICLLCTDKPVHASELALVMHEWINHPLIFTIHK